MQPNILQLLQN